MDATLKRLNADLYQLNGEETSLEHVASSGALSVATIYANHAQQEALLGHTLDAIALPTGFSEVPRAYVPTAPIGVDYEAPIAGFQTTPLTGPALGGVTNLDAPATAVLTESAAAEPAGRTLPGERASIVSSFLPSSNGNNGSNGAPGTDGGDGSPGDGSCPPRGHECAPGGQGDTNITIVDIDIVNNTVTNVSNVNHVTLIDVNNTINTVTSITENVTNLIDLSSITNTVNSTINTVTNLIDVNNILTTVSNVVNPVTSTVANLVDIDILGGGHHGGNDPNLLDLDLLSGDTVQGNDNDLLDLGIGGRNGIGGNDNDIIDLNLLGMQQVGGDDNDVIDLGLGGHHHVGGNNHDLVHAGLFGQTTTGGNANHLVNLGLGNEGATDGYENNLIDLGLNDHSTAAGGTSNAVGLDLNLLDNAPQPHDGGHLLGGGVDLLSGGTLADGSVNLGHTTIADLGTSQGIQLGSDLLGANVSVTNGGITADSSLLDTNLTLLNGSTLADLSQNGQPLIDLSLNDPTSPQGSLLDGNTTLLQGDTLAGIDLSLGSQPVANLGVTDHQIGTSVGPIHVGLDLSNLLTPDLLIRDLFLPHGDSGLHVDLHDAGTGLGQGDNSLLNALGIGDNSALPIAADHGSGTVLGLHLSLSPWH